MDPGLRPGDRFSCFFADLRRNQAIAVDAGYSTETGVRS
jgi:hypothetical protein